MADPKRMTNGDLLWDIVSLMDNEYNDERGVFLQFRLDPGARGVAYVDVLDESQHIQDTFTIEITNGGF